MRFTIGRGTDRNSFDRPLGKEARRSMALDIKRAMFPGKSYRTHKERGAAALANPAFA